MIIFKLSTGLRAFLSSKVNENIPISFVPTMGALHSGHASLVANARKEEGMVVCSIFVNPTQFNDKKDFEKKINQYTKAVIVVHMRGAPASK